MYYEKEIDFQCLTYQNSECASMVDSIVGRFTEILLKHSIEEIVDIIISSESLEPVTMGNIPQLSQLDKGMFHVIEILMESGQAMLFEELGYYLEQKYGSDEPKVGAQKKYGENHGKMAALMDLAVVGKQGQRVIVYPSVLGEGFYKMGQEMQEGLAKRLLLRIPMVQNVFVNQSVGQIDKDMEILSLSTRKRRRSNVINVVKSIIEGNENLSNRIGFEGE